MSQRKLIYFRNPVPACQHHCIDLCSKFNHNHRHFQRCESGRPSLCPLPQPQHQTHLPSHLGVVEGVMPLTFGCSRLPLTHKHQMGHFKLWLNSLTSLPHPACSTCQPPKNQWRKVEQAEEFDGFLSMVQYT